MTKQTANKIHRLTRAARRNGWTVESGVDAPLPTSYTQRPREWVEIQTEGADRAFDYVQHAVSAGVVVGGERKWLSLAELIRRTEAGRIDLKAAAVAA